MRYLFVIAAALHLCGGCAVSRMTPAEPITVKKIWDQAPHNAFTDLLRFNNLFYCTFREGKGHVTGSPDGKARVLRSADGERWESVALLEVKDRDVRDPKLSVTPDNRLMVLMDVESHQNGKVAGRKPYVSFSNAAGTNFTPPAESVVDPAVASWSDWVWRVTWYNGYGYSIVYQPEGRIYLLRTKDGRYFEQVSALAVDGLPNESTIRFDRKGRMYVLIRREQGNRLGVLATSKAPYREWRYQQLDQRLGGPDFLFLDNETLCIGSRLYPAAGAPGGPATALFITDLDGKRYNTIRLPSGGDTSYPGLLVYDGKLWVSYYSSHEGKAAIYLATIPMSQLNGE